MVFFTDGVSGFKNFKYLCSSFLCCVCGVISLCSWLFFMDSDLWIGLGFIFESVLNSLIFQ